MFLCRGRWSILLPAKIFRSRRHSSLMTTPKRHLVRQGKGLRGARQLVPPATCDKSHQFGATRDPGERLATTIIMLGWLRAHAWGRNTISEGSVWNALSNLVPCWGAHNVHNFGLVASKGHSPCMPPSPPCSLS